MHFTALEIFKYLFFVWVCVSFYAKSSGFYFFRVNISVLLVKLNGAQVNIMYDKGLAKDKPEGRDMRKNK